MKSKLQEKEKGKVTNQITISRALKRNKKDEMKSYMRRERRGEKWIRMK